MPLRCLLYVGEEEGSVFESAMWYVVNLAPSFAKQDEMRGFQFSYK